MESFRERNYDFRDFKFDDDRNIEYEQFRELRKMIRDTDFSTFKRPHTWTFTFKYDQSLQSAKKKMRHFLNVLNKQVYGNASQRFNKRLKCIPILEKDDNTRIHYHLILEHLSQRQEDILLSRDLSHLQLMPIRCQLLTHPTIYLPNRLERSHQKGIISIVNFVKNLSMQVIILSFTSASTMAITANSDNQNTYLHTI